MYKIQSEINEKFQNPITFETVEEISLFIKNNNYTTLVGENNSVKSTLSKSEDLGEWLSFHTNIKILYDTKLLSCLTNINDIYMATSLLRSDDWIGNADAFGVTVYSNLNFCLEMIKHPKWDGKIYIFSDHLSNPEFAEKILESEFWDGNAIFDDEVLQDYKIFVKIINCIRWNGHLVDIPDYVKNYKAPALEALKCPRWKARNNKSFSETMRSDIDVCKAMMRNPNWDGSCSYIEQNILNNIEFLEELFDDYRWDGRTFCINKNKVGKENIFYIYKLMINHPKWDGSADKMGTEILSNKDFISDVLKIKNWNGVYSMFGINVRSDIELCCRIVEHPKWISSISHFTRNVVTDFRFCLSVIRSKNWKGSAKNFPQRIMKNINFCRIMISSPKWNGDCSNISRKILDENYNFIHDIVDSDNWNGDCSYFNPKHLNEDCLMLKIIYSDNWNGDCSNFPSRILSDIDYVKMIIGSKKWNKCDKFFSAKIRKSPLFI